MALSGCDGGYAVIDDPTTTTGESTDVDLGTGPARARRRMDIDQLDQSIRVATGGIGWDSGDTNLFRTYRTTLGAPDYLQSTREDLEASPLFLKFVDDAARSVCDRLLDREADAAATDHTFLVYADLESTLPADQGDIDQNLAYLLLRFHNRAVDVESDELGPWRSLWSSSLELTRTDEGEVDAKTAWQTVCVALIDHPDFWSY